MIFSDTRYEMSPIYVEGAEFIVPCFIVCCGELEAEAVMAGRQPQFSTPLFSLPDSDSPMIPAYLLIYASTG